MDYETVTKRRDAAVRRIQAAWRTYKARKAFVKMRHAASTIQAVAKGWYVRKKLAEARGRHDMEQRFHAIIEKRREKMRLLEAEKREILAMPGSELEEWEQRRFFAAVRMQAHWRGLVARRKMAQSPERLRREKAAATIQSAFKKLMRQRRATGALAQAASAAATAAFASPHGSPLRQSHMRLSSASVLLGSPQPGFEGQGPGPGARLSPQQAARAGLVVEEEEEDVLTRNAKMMGPRRYKELKNQVDGKLSAYLALAKARGAARRPDAALVDERLGELLADYNASAQERLAAVATRQRNLVVVDTLCKQLEQVRPLAELPTDAQPQDFPRPPRGSERFERAKQAHALALAEAKVGSRWWLHLKGLNTKAVQDMLTAEDEDRWDALDAKWRRMWKALEEQENKRPDVLNEFAPRVGAGAEAVAAAKAEAAQRAKLAEYKQRLDKAATAMAASPVGGSYRKPVDRR
ncbi:hypothetical protein HYH03_015037 [Edaphochlamys debaryana]|uniref:Uncharacterized protein n=1 Tax=Edaphochlamys debaryana TaxID=47281 RepID=A0A835XLM8_9CHLO|nr:hypothetical protein HYH03_015037 [Edaphochlamys debaryana]|eukprot:KAG2486333.1 hypothetical protein HYH03_015037 [Edaphochlamys debaryana]